METRSESKAKESDSLRVAALYEAKTIAILQRYGPGPRVHYHTGFVNESQRPSTVAALRARLVESQEEMLRYTSEFWKLHSVEFQNILDVGCGLGGSAIFWAQEFGARVTAITIAPSHVELVARFARQAGVESLVAPILCDASAVPGEGCFDAAIAIESSSLFPRRPWFQSLARTVRPGGRVFVFDCFLTRCEYEEQFNDHWCGQIGTFEEYLEAASEGRFSLEAVEDTSLRTASFWRTSLALIRAEQEETSPDPSQLRTIEKSRETHALMCRGLVNGGLQQLLMTFLKPG